MSKEIKSIKDLQPDDRNANRGTQRGQYMVETSLRRAGAGRSIVADKNGKLIAGNKTLESWADLADDEDIIAVKTDGKKLVVVVREDLDLDDEEDKTARELAYFDNRASEVGLAWEVAQLAEDLQSGVDLLQMFREDELDYLISENDEISLDIDEEAEEGFAEGEQFKTDRVIEIPLDLNVLNDEDFRTALDSLCSQFQLEYKIKAG